LIGEARELDPDIAGDRRLQCRRAKRLHQQIARKAGKAKSKSTSDLKPLYSELLGMVETISQLAAEVKRALAPTRANKRRGLNVLNDAIAQALGEQLGH
jgi:hypothetical protein